MALDSLQSSIPGIAYDRQRPDTSVPRDRTPPKGDIPESGEAATKPQARVPGVWSKTGLPVAGNATRQFALEAPTDVAATYIRDEGLRSAIAQQISQTRFAKLQPGRAQVRPNTMALVTTWPKAQAAATSVAQALHREGTIAHPECIPVAFGADAPAIDAIFARLRDEGPGVVLIDARIFASDVPGCAAGSTAPELAHRLVPLLRDNPLTQVLIAGSEDVVRYAIQADRHLERSITRRVRLAIDTFGALEGIANLALREIASRDIIMSHGAREPGPPVRVFLKASSAEALTAAAQYAATLNEVELVTSPQTFELAHGANVDAMRDQFARVGALGTAVLVVEARMFIESMPGCAAGSTAERMHAELLSFMSDHAGVRVLLHGNEEQLWHLRTADPHMARRVPFNIPL